MFKDIVQESDKKSILKINWWKHLDNRHDKRAELSLERKEETLNIRL